MTAAQQPLGPKGRGRDAATMRGRSGTGREGTGRLARTRRKVVSQYRLGVVRTGGTVGSSTRSLGSSDEMVVTLSGVKSDTQLFAEVLGTRWDERKWSLQYAQPNWRQPSENMAPSDWTDIAVRVTRLAHQGSDMVLVLHGTDTAGYTAAALSFLLADLPVPVVLTGSNVPPSDDETDAYHNISHALTALTRLVPGTYLSFAGVPSGPSRVHLGTSVRKVLASSQSFFSVNRLPVGSVVDVDKKSEFRPSKDYRRRGWVDRELVSTIPVARGDREFDTRVFSFSIYPGCNLQHLFDWIVKGDYRGVVLQLYPSGTGPEHDDPRSPTSLPRFIEQCTERGVVVVGTVPVGPSLKTNHYESTLALLDAGAVLSRYLLPETALVKLMWLLARSEDVDWIKEMMIGSIAGEIPDDESIGRFHAHFA
jgi:L-asparaginase